MKITLMEGKAALVIAHPGHELRVYHWLRLVRPLCFVLTDGSGHSGVSRLASTSKLLERNGSQPGSIYGRFTDQTLYSAMMKGDLEVFVELAEELSEQLGQQAISYVVGDASEGYNPAHDVCRLIINAAVKRANVGRTNSILNLEVCLTGQASHHAETTGDEICLDLDEDSISKKLEALNAYSELATEVDRILNQEGIEAIRTERLRRVCNKCDGITEPPYYELHGMNQVKAGYYEQVLRYREHVFPIAEALMNWVQLGAR